MILRQYLIILAIFVKQEIMTTEKSRKIAENKQKDVKLNKNLHVVKNKQKKQQEHLQIRFIIMIYHTIC